jgi:hypothetical protein
MGKATFDERIKKTNARLEVKEKDARERVTQELTEEFERETEKIRMEYCSKAKSQEECFASKQKELEK